MEEIFAKASQGEQLGNSFTSELLSQATGGISNISVGGIKLGDVAGVFTGDPTAVLSLVSGVAKKILPSNFANLSFGAVFANGFKLSCINSATVLRPTYVKADIEKYAKPHFTRRIAAIEAAQTLATKQAAINLFIKDVATIISHYKDHLLPGTNWSSCSEDGITTYIKFMYKFRDAADVVLAELVSKGATVTNATSGPVTITLEGKVYGKNNPSNSRVTYPQVDLSTIRQVAPETPAENPNAQNGGTNQNGNVPPKSDSGINPLILLSVAGLAAKLLL
jgi:hypothetical protein